MNVTNLRFALGVSVLFLSTGMALSDDAPASATRNAAASGKCPSVKTQQTNVLLYNAVTTARHNNVSQVRYTAAHALPSARTYTALAMAICSPANKSVSTALD